MRICIYKFGPVPKVSQAVPLPFAVQHSTKLSDIFISELTELQNHRPELRSIRIRIIFFEVFPMIGLCLMLIKQYHHHHRRPLEPKLLLVSSEEWEKWERSHLQIFHDNCHSISTLDLTAEIMWDETKLRNLNIFLTFLPSTSISNINQALMEQA